MMENSSIEASQEVYRYILLIIIKKIAACKLHGGTCPYTMLGQVPASADPATCAFRNIECPSGDRIDANSVDVCCVWRKFWKYPEKQVEKLGRGSRLKHGCSSWDMKPVAASLYGQQGPEQAVLRSTKIFVTFISRGGYETTGYLDVSL